MVVECFFRIQITTWAITKLFHNWFKKMYFRSQEAGWSTNYQSDLLQSFSYDMFEQQLFIKEKSKHLSFKIWTFSYIVIQSSSFKEVNKDYKWLRPPSSLKSKSFFFFRSYNVCTLFINIFNVKEKKENFRQRSDSKQYVQLIHIGNMFSYR